MIQLVSLVLTLDPASAHGSSSGWLTIHLVRNTGASGRIGAAYPTVVTLVGVVIAAIAGTLALRTHSRGAAPCLAAVLAGSRASFNLADLAIQLGALSTVIAMFATRQPVQLAAEQS